MENYHLATLLLLFTLMQQWEDMLSQDGINSKKTVREQMKKVIEGFPLYEELKKFQKEIKIK